MFLYTAHTSCIMQHIHIHRYFMYYITNMSNDSNEQNYACESFSTKWTCWVFPGHLLLFLSAHLPDLQDLTYAELMMTSPVQRVHFTSTLGRPRTSNTKQQEPTIYAQVSFLVGLSMYWIWTSKQQEYKLQTNKNREKTRKTVKEQKSRRFEMVQRVRVNRFCFEWDLLSIFS